jgi:hypothetical protein
MDSHFSSVAVFRRKWDDSWNVVRAMELPRGALADASAFLWKDRIGPPSNRATERMAAPRAGYIS